MILFTMSLFLSEHILGKTLEAAPKAIGKKHQKTSHKTTKKHYSKATPTFEAQVTPTPTQIGYPEATGTDPETSSSTSTGEPIQNSAQNEISYLSLLLASLLL